MSEKKYVLECGEGEMMMSIFSKHNQETRKIMFCPKCGGMNINYSAIDLKLLKCNDCGYTSNNFPEKTVGNAEKKSKIKKTKKKSTKTRKKQ